MVSLSVEKTSRLSLHKRHQRHTHRNPRQGCQECAGQGIAGLFYFDAHKIDAHGVEDGLRTA